jgi:hypothetical protein
MTLDEQCRHQVRIMRERMPWWISSIFAAGFVFSSIGLFASLAALREDGSMTARLVAFTIFFLLFGWAVLRMLLPIRPRPRIVPYFAAELGVLGGDTMTAFARGRGLYLEITALDALAHSRGVKPLSTFGFAYDHFGQQVHWHPAADGLATAQALRQERHSPAVAEDLEALARVLHIAAGKDVPFSLVLRLWEKDSLQVVCTRETRQGSFW